MQISAGYELSYECPKPTPMLLTLNIHPSRRADLLTPIRFPGAMVYQKPPGGVSTAAAPVPAERSPGGA